MPVLQIPTHKARPYQKPFWSYMEGGGRRAFLVWHRRCLASGTHVTMADGSWRPIETLRPGDELLSWTLDGITTAKCTAVWFAGVKPVVEAKMSGQRPLICTPDHRIASAYFGEHGWTGFDWRRADSLGRRATMVHASTGCGTARALELAELVGYLLTDGSVHAEQSPKFTTTTPELRDRVVYLAPRVFQGCVPRVREKGNGWDIHLSNGRAGGGAVTNPVKEWFRAQGALAKGSDRRVPRVAWTWDEPTLFAFFSAVIDGDGTIYTQKKGRVVVDEKRGPRPGIMPATEVRIAVGESERLAWDYHHLLRKLGVNSLICEDRPGVHKCWSLRVLRREDAHRLVDGVRPIKKAKARAEAIERRGQITPRQQYAGCHMGIVSVADAGVAPTWDIEVEGTACFFANGYLVHNSGKDDSAASWTSVAALEDKPAVYWHMLPEYAQARKAIWTAVNPHTGKRRIDEWFPPAIRKTTREQTMEIEFVNGSLWQVVGSDSYDSLVGASVKGLVGSEWALANPLAWAYLRPILRENNGWAIFPSTPRGRNHLFRMYEAAEADPEQFAQRLTAYETGIIKPEDLEKERLEMIAEMGEEDGEAKFRQEWLCDWSAALVGAYYTREFRAIDDEKRITDVPYDPGLPVFTAWDLGVGDQTAIWFAQLDGGGTVRIIDYEVASGVSVDHYARLVLGKPYTYKAHIVPHDAGNRDWSALNNQSRLDILKGLGIAPLIHLPRDNIDDGVQAARRLLARCVFDKMRTGDGVAALRAYRRVWNEKHKRFDPKPLHDWASDPADAFRYLAMGLPAKLALSPSAIAQRRRDRERDVSSSEWSF